LVVFLEWGTALSRANVSRSIMDRHFL
jgi:hypothetical protein